ncbi:hypothetical protein EDD21DRAFT_383894 [Dissophora ornata]|nr:hypothetical protein EDD21DRAFT_383894 [Dissophora ornata]
MLFSLRGWATVAYMTACALSSLLEAGARTDRALIAQGRLIISICLHTAYHRRSGIDLLPDYVHELKDLICSA